jgi:hypothetical protein
MAPWLVWRAAEFLFSAPSVNAIFLILLGVAVAVWYDRLLQAVGFPHSFELGFSVLAGLIFLLGFMQALISPMLKAEDMAAAPCAPQTLQSQCYTMPHDACTSIWTQYEQSCRQQVEAKPENNKVGALLGLQIKHCAQRKFDRSFKSSRRLMSNADCYQLFSSIDAPE